MVKNGACLKQGHSVSSDNVDRPPWIGTSGMEDEPPGSPRRDQLKTEAGKGCHESARNFNGLGAHPPERPVPISARAARPGTSATAARCRRPGWRSVRIRGIRPPIAPYFETTSKVCLRPVMHMVCADSPSWMSFCLSRLYQREGLPRMAACRENQRGSCNPATPWGNRMTRECEPTRNP